LRAALEAPVRLAELAPHALEERLESCPALLLPIGTIEYHGDHLPLGLDGLKAEAIAGDAARRSGAILGPLSWWAADGVDRPYTLRLDAGLIEPMLVEGLVQLAGMGFRAIVLVNGHFGLENSRLLRRVALAVMERCEAVVWPVAEYEILLDLGDRGDHAGLWETSLLLGVRPELVNLESLVPGVAARGVIGADPRGASRRQGEDGVAQAGTRIAVAVERLLSLVDAERGVLVESLTSALGALDVLAGLRAQMPREQVPPVLTPAWERHLRALDAGEFELARRAAEEKRADPAA
jgi:creatinine amidohydrolase